MSLDVYLEGAGRSVYGTGIYVRENGQTREISRDEWDEKFPGREPVIAEPSEGYSANITHNLGKMADAAGIYYHLWRPEEIGITLAAQLIEPLTEGLARLASDPDKFKAYNPPNGWGDYDGLIRFVTGYLAACQQFPTATVRACR